MSLKKDLIEIRLESFGGLGASLCSKILGELGAMYLGLNASCFSNYGIEKRGSPVKAYVRYAKENVPIRDSNPVRTPDILAIFHISLCENESILQGVSEKTSIVVNTDRDIDDVRDILKLYAGELYCVDALKIAQEEGVSLNMAMLGAIARTNDFMPLEKIEELLRDSKKYDENIEQNINAIRKGYENVVHKQIKIDGKYEYLIPKDIQSPIGYKNAPIGNINPWIGSTISNDLSPIRKGYVPILQKEKCVNCGLCDLACPDMAFKFEKREYNGKQCMVNMGIDYHYCKGCMRCIGVCKYDALIKVKEDEANLDGIRLIDKNIKYDKVGANSLVTCESFNENIDI